MTRHIMVVTGTRADYGLLDPLLAALEASSAFEVGLLVTGTHLDERFGMTVREIEADRHRIAARVPLPLDDDSEAGVSRATGAAVSGIATALADTRPSMVVILGDRYEALAAAVAATLMRVPIAHLHGGETTEGAIDDSMRHAITKLSTLHFVSTEEYGKRVIQMGEDPARVFCVGALGVDNALRTNLIAPPVLASELGFEFARPTALMTFHPVTLDDASGVTQVEELLAAFNTLRDVRVLITRPNADAGNRVIRERLEAWVAANAPRAKSFASLGRVRYLSAVAACDVVVGNSSSGVIEAPSLGTPSVDIGDRQAGRVRAASVIHAEPEREMIADAIQRALSADFAAMAALTPNPYGDGHAAQRIVDVLSVTRNLITRKRFRDLPDEGER